MNVFPEITFFHFSYRRAEQVTELRLQKLPYIDLTYCVDGNMRYIYNGEELELSGGDAILFPEGATRVRIASDEPALYASFNLRFAEEFVPEVQGYLPKSLRSDTPSMLESIRKAHLSVGEKKSEKCHALFYYLYNQLIETARENEHPHIKHIKKYIAKHLQERITLSDIADEVHLVPHYCCALFSKYEGMGIVDFILHRRIELAKSLIMESTMPLSDIALHTGFGDYNYFSRTFKKIAGVTASEFKKQQFDPE